MKTVSFLIATLILYIQKALCASSIQLLGVSINWQNTGSSTDFNVSWTPSPLPLSDLYVSIGLNSNGAMSGSNVVVCYVGANSNVQHNLNSGYQSSAMSSGRPKLGLSNTFVGVSNGKVSCSFSRDNSNSQAGYIGVDQRASLYLMIAYGQATVSSGLVSVGYHG